MMFSGGVAGGFGAASTNFFFFFKVDDAVRFHRSIF